MKQYNVTGMSCAACSARVEKAVSKVSGVTSCSVNLLTNSMNVDGTASDDDIIKAVTSAGYGASLHGTDLSDDKYKDDALADRETPKMKKRLISSIVFLAALMYISMGHIMMGWYLPSPLSSNPIAIGITEMLLAFIVMVINKKFFINGFKGMLKLNPNMDTLVALGSGASFVYSVFVLYSMTAAGLSGGVDAAHPFLHDFYFESAAMILTLITVGKMLEARSKGKTTDALKGLMNLAPKTASVIRSGKESVIPISEVRIGDVFVVRPGESIPADGVVIEGSSAVNESALTGESIPVDKTIGDNVSSATINQSGFLKCRAERVGENTVLSQIIRMVTEAASSKAPIAKVADKVSGIFVPVVIGIAFITLVVWLIADKDIGFALARAISVLVISCPCALGLATPVAIMVGNGIGAKNGILFKNASALEHTGRTQIVVLDKTGTITKGEPAVTDIIPCQNVLESKLMATAVSLESKSEHPLAKAILNYASFNDITSDEVQNFKVHHGNGLSGVYNDINIFGGNQSFIETHAHIPEYILKSAASLSESGKTPLFFAEEGKLLGVIAVADTIKEDSPQAIRELKNMGIYVVMLTGDNERTAKAIAGQCGADEVIAGVRPDGKEAVIQSLCSKGKTIMVGDGINDAPALTRADIGIAIGAGTDIAIDAADVVLMNSRLTDVPAAIRLSRSVLRNIHENLFWAFVYNIIGIPLAAGLWIPFFGIKLSPMFGAAAMSLSSICVVSNALRLNLKNIYDAKHDKKIKNAHNKKRLASSSKKICGAGISTLHIKGMMCNHCEASVKNALESLPQVDKAIPDFKKGTTVVELNDCVSCSELKKVIKAQGYKLRKIS